jgi:hypothetical protein
VSSAIVVVGTAFTSSANEVLSAHWPLEGVKMYVPFTELFTTTGFHVPAIPFADVSDSPGTVEPMQID